MIYGYMRVSTGTQELENQKLKISTQYKIDTWVQDIGTGSKVQVRLKALLEAVRPGDTIIVTALDRLGRNVVNCAQIAEYLRSKKVNLISMREAVDFSTPSGQMAFNIMISMAEFERNIMKERIRDGIIRAKKAGKRFGPPNRLTTDQEIEAAGAVLHLKDMFKIGYRDLAEILKKHYGVHFCGSYVHGLLKKYAKVGPSRNDSIYSLAVEHLSANMG